MVVRVSRSPLLSRSGPVSYTHLDVYKRQAVLRQYLESPRLYDMRHIYPVILHILTGLLLLGVATLSAQEMCIRDSYGDAPHNRTFAVLLLFGTIDIE